MADFYATLTYYPNDGSSSWSDTETGSNAQGYGYVTFSLPTLSRAGYTFNGWSFGGNLYTGAISLYADYNGESYSVSASWTQNPPTYTIGANITWDNSGGTPSSYTHNPRVQSESTGESIGVSTPLVAPTKAGYTFDGWNVGGTLYGTGQPITIWADTSFPSYTFSASWTLITYNVTITFDADGGSPTPSPISTSYSYPDTYASITMPNTVPTKSGYAFGGWGANFYQPGQTYNFTAGSYTLIAQWLGVPASGKVKVKTANGWTTATPYVKTSNGWERAYAEVFDGTGWIVTNG